MSVSVLLERIDDWINPIVVKELRQAVKSRVVVSILMLFLGVQLFLLGVCLVFGDIGEETARNWNAGNLVFRWQQGILLFTLMIMVPAYAATRLAAERSDTNVDLLFISTLHPRSIISGKFFAALVLAMLIFSTCAPFMTFTYLLRGIDIPTILFVLASDLLLMLFSTMIALFLAAVPGARAIKLFLGFLGFIGMALAFMGTVRATIALIEFGTGTFAAVFDFWTVTAVVVAAILGLVGLFYVYSVALISPASSNRMLPVRVYFFGLWLVMGISLFLTSYYNTPTMTLVPVTIFWVFGAGLLLCVQFCISICEREQWGPRVANAIPRHWLLRPLAFLFYTGSAGGILFTTLLALATLGSTWWWTEQWAGTLSGRFEPTTAPLRIMTAICLYFFCYGLSAVLVRTHVLAGQLRPAYTWLVGLLLVGLGSSIPSVIAYVGFQDQMRHQTDGGWWMLPNPFMAVYEISNVIGWSRNEEFATRCFWFLGIWAAVVTALNMPWMIGQMQAFHRPRKRKAAPAEMTAVVAETPSVVAGEI